MELLFRYTLFQPSLRPRFLFRYPLFLLGKNQDCYSDILRFYLTQIGIAIQISLVFTWQKSGLLFRYPLFLLDKNQDCSIDILCFYPAQDQDCYSDILYFYLAQIRTAIQISSVSTRPKTKTTIQISSVSTWHKLGLPLRYPLFLPDTNRDCYLDIPCFYLAKIRIAIQISSVST